VSAGEASASLTRGENREQVLNLIERHQQETWKWQRVMQRPLTKTRNVAMRSPDPEFRLWALDWWRERAETARRQAKNPPYLSSWLCIQGYEGPWDDPNAPYYGGLQMDLSFQRTYGRELLRRKGTADRWSPLEQIWVAVKAHRSGRGFYPWPNTARYCGLI
jgi:hypothetical protein